MNNYRFEYAFTLLFAMLKDKGIKFTDSELKNFYNETLIDVDDISERMTDDEKNYLVLEKEKSE